MIIGIDPGLDGAVAVLSDDDKVIDIFDMPTVEDGSKRLVNVPMLHYSLQSHSSEANEPVTVFIERVRPLRQGGFQAAFAFGRTYQSCIAVAACLGLRVEYAEPTAWKKANGLKGGKDQKKNSIAKVVQLYPSECHYFTRAKDSDRAEALLIAKYGLDLQQVKTREAA